MNKHRSVVPIIDYDVKSKKNKPPDQCIQPEAVMGSGLTYTIYPMYNRFLKNKPQHMKDFFTKNKIGCGKE